MYGEKDILAEILVFLTNVTTDLSSNTSICLKARVIFGVMKLCRYVIVDDGGN